MSKDTIYRQAAIDAVRQYCIDNLIEDVDYHSDGIEYELNNLPPAEPEQRWIPVTERLPEKNGNYLIMHRLPWKSETGEDRYEVDMDYWQWNTWDDDNDVVAWMSLPEPYKGEVKNEIYSDIRPSRRL